MLLKSGSKFKSVEVTWKVAVPLVALPTATALYTLKMLLYFGEVTVIVYGACRTQIMFNLANALLDGLFHCAAAVQCHLQSTGSTTREHPEGVGRALAAIMSV